MTTTVRNLNNNYDTSSLILNIKFVSKILLCNDFKLLENAFQKT